MRAPNHGRPYDYPYDGRHGQWDYADRTPSPQVEPSDNEPHPAIYGPKGEVLRWKQRRIGYRRLDPEDPTA